MRGYSDTPFLGSIGKQVVSIEILKTTLLFSFMNELTVQ